MSRSAIQALRKTKSGMKPCDIRPLIYSLSGYQAHLLTTLALTEREACKPPMLIAALAREAGIQEEQEIRILVKRLRLLATDQDGQLIPLERLP